LAQKHGWPCHRRAPFEEECMGGKTRSRGPVLRTLIWLAITAGLLYAFAFFATRAYTPPVKDQAGRVLPESVAALDRVSLGGTAQYILVRGKNRSNPVLLFLHGGPGMPMMYLSHAFQRPLEEEFVVVQWDRRGAGKSYDSRIPPQTINVQQEIADTRELTELLRSRFRHNRIYLVGHSYGSYLGILAAQRFPELFYAYVGVGQLACSKEINRQIQDHWIRKEAIAARNQAALKQVNGKEPMDREKWLFEFGGELYRERKWLPLLLIGLRSPEYSLVDDVHIVGGVNFTLRNMRYNAISGDLIDVVTDLKLPVYFFTGRHDYTAPFQCTQEYYRRINAPGKKMVWFDASAHFPFFEEPQKFAAEMKKVVLETSGY
jgi:pimeloyl-ACP methyl ester carboxylesterase